MNFSFLLPTCLLGREGEQERECESLPIWLGEGGPYLAGSGIVGRSSVDLPGQGNGNQSEKRSTLVLPSHPWLGLVWNDPHVWEE